MFSSEVVYFDSHGTSALSDFISCKEVYIDRWVFSLPDEVHHRMMVPLGLREDDDPYVIMIHAVIER